MATRAMAGAAGRGLGGLLAAATLLAVGCGGGGGGGGAPPPEGAVPSNLLVLTLRDPLTTLPILEFSPPDSTTLPTTLSLSGFAGEVGLGDELSAGPALAADNTTLAACSSDGLLLSFDLSVPGDPPGAIAGAIPAAWLGVGRLGWSATSSPRLAALAIDPLDPSNPGVVTFGIAGDGSASAVSSSGPAASTVATAVAWKPGTTTVALAGYTLDLLGGTPCGIAVIDDVPGGSLPPVAFTAIPDATSGENIVDLEWVPGSSRLVALLTGADVDGLPTQRLVLWDSSTASTAREFAPRVDPALAADPLLAWVTVDGIAVSGNGLQIAYLVVGRDPDGLPLWLEIRAVPTAGGVDAQIRSQLLSGESVGFGLTWTHNAVLPN